MQQYFKSPIGIMEIIFDKDSVSEINFVKKKLRNESNKVIKQLSKYFSGVKKEFDVKLKLDGTKFQKRVWQQLLKIPYGKTATYSYVAKAIKKPKAVRAVANAIAANKIPIIIPCHRVVGKKGLGGFSCGVWRKKYLLELEK